MAQLWARDRPEADLPLADPLQLLWDVARAPGADVDQAVAALRPVLKARAAAAAFTVSAAHRLVLVSAGRASARRDPGADLGYRG